MTTASESSKARRSASVTSDFKLMSASHAAARAVEAPSAATVAALTSRLAISIALARVSTTARSASFSFSGAGVGVIAPKTSLSRPNRDWNKVLHASSLANNSSRFNRTFVAFSPATAARSCSARSFESCLSSASSSAAFASSASMVVAVSLTPLRSSYKRFASSVRRDNSPIAASETAEDASSSAMCSARLRVASLVSTRSRTDSSAAASSRFAASASAPRLSSSLRCFALRDSAAACSASSRTLARSFISFAARDISATSASAAFALADKQAGSGFKSGCLSTSSRMNTALSAILVACASLSAESLPCRFIATSRLSLYALIVSCKSCTARSSSLTFPLVSSIVSLNCASRFCSSSVESVSSESRAARRRAVSATIASLRASICPRFSMHPRSAMISSCPARRMSSCTAIC